MFKQFVFILACTICVSLNAQELNVMSFNIRLNLASDSLNAWPHRKDKVVSQIIFHEVQLLGVQEALHEQMRDLNQSLSKFKYAGVGRDDGKEKGEYSAIFYDTTRLKLLESKTFWLSLTPASPGSKSWDAAYTRIVTWAKFTDIKSGKTFYAFNTHFDHLGMKARNESAKLLLQKIHEIAGGSPSIITGDFNAVPNSEPVKILTDKSDSLRLRDSKELSRTGHYGPTGTFNAFGPKERDDFPIDYIFLKGKWNVLSHATISQTWQGRFASDHFAVLTTLSY